MNTPDEKRPGDDAQHGAHTQPGSASSLHGVGTDVGKAPDVKPAATKTVLTTVAVVAVLLVILLLSSFIPRRSVTKELAAEVAGEDAPPIVQVMTVKRAEAGGTLDLPGTIQPLHESAVYARVAGYVKNWHADIGKVVRTGDELAEIDAPELEQQVSQADHQLAQSRAALGLAKTDLDRWRTMIADSAVTREEFDQKQSAYDAANANTGAAAANYQRLVEMQKFTKVRAPFAGVITARNVDIGSLIGASGATSAPVAGGDIAGAQGPGSLFRIAQTDTVRTYISAPETQAMAMTPGLAARVSVQELPGRTFTGHIARTSRSIDVGSRTMLIEVDIANPGFVLLPGMFSNVEVTFPKSAAPLIIPASALVIRAAGTQVMVLDSAAQTIHMQQVQVGRDYGATIEILGGIGEGTTVVTNPNADMIEGMKVKVAAAVGK